MYQRLPLLRTLLSLKMPMPRNARTCLLTVTSGTRTGIAHGEAMLVGYQRDPSSLPEVHWPLQWPWAVPRVVITARIPTAAPTWAPHIPLLFHLCTHKPRSHLTMHHHHRHLLNRNSLLGGRSPFPIYRAWMLQLLASLGLQVITTERGTMSYNIDKRFSSDYVFQTMTVKFEEYFMVLWLWLWLWFDDSVRLCPFPIPHSPFHL